MRNKFTIMLLLSGVLFLLTGCGLLNPKTGGWRKQAEKNAVTFIENKYGFEAKVKKSVSVAVDDLFYSKATSTTYVTLADESGKEFHVLIEGGESNGSDGRDDYQKDVITADIRKLFTDRVSEQPEDIEVYYSYNHGIDYYFDYMLKEKYDESLSGDLDACREELTGVFGRDDLASPLTIYILASYVDEKTSNDFNIEEMVHDTVNFFPLPERIHLLAVNYRTEKDYEEHRIISDPTQMVDDMDRYYFAYGPYISSVAEVVPNFKSTEFNAYTFELGHIDDFYYMIPNRSPDEYTIISEPMDQSEADEFNGRGFIAAKSQGSKYLVEGEGLKGAIYVYRDKEKKPAEIMARYLFTNSDGVEKVSYNKGFCNLYSEVDEYDFYHVYGTENPDYMFCFLKDSE